jgi:hypothetical protein
MKIAILMICDIAISKHIDNVNDEDVAKMIDKLEFVRRLKEIQL